MEFYKIEMYSSRFRHFKKPTMANRLSAFNLWKIVDTNKQGHIPIYTFIELLEACAFEEIKNHEELVKEAEIALQFLPNELKKEECSSNLYRFRLFEYLFMERCALFN